MAVAGSQPNRTVEQCSDVRRSQAVEEIVGAAQTVLQERSQRRMVKQATNPPCSSCGRAVAKIIPRKRVQRRMVVQIQNIPVPQSEKDACEAVKIVPQVRARNRSVERIQDVPASQVVEKVVGAVKIGPEKRSSASWSSLRMVTALGCRRRPSRLSRSFRRKASSCALWNRSPTCRFRRSRS